MAIAMQYVQGSTDEACTVLCSILGPNPVRNYGVPILKAKPGTNSYVDNCKHGTPSLRPTWSAHYCKLISQLKNI